MEWRQLLCITVCVLELAGCRADSTTDTPTATGAAVTARDSSSGTASTASTASTATADTSSTKTTSAGATGGSVATNPTSSEQFGQLRTSPRPSPALTPVPGTSLDPHGSPGVSTAPSPPGTQPRDRAHTSGPAAAGTSSVTTPVTDVTTVPDASTAPHTARHSPEPPVPAIQCHGARGDGDTGAVCLQLNESSSCQQFLDSKGSDLWQAICENRTHSVDSPCQIKLTPSNLDRDCLLLILEGEKDPDKLLNTLQKSPWEKFGIESLKKESGRRQRDPSQRTLIALVTSGLLLAFLGLAGYFLMKRRSWSPAGQRLAEDPYYTEQGSQGNTLLMTPSQEPAELQEKPNLPSLNGATQENGTGQNGHSGRQHSPADTEM